MPEWHPHFLKKTRSRDNAPTDYYFEDRKTDGKPLFFNSYPGMDGVPGRLANVNHFLFAYDTSSLGKYPA